MKKTLTFCLLLLALMTEGQSFEWLQTPTVSYDANPDLIGYSNTIDPSGHVYMAGFQGERYLYGGVFGHLMLNKYSPSGELLFSKTIEGHAQVYNLKSDALGNVYMLAGYVGIFKYGEVNLNTVQQGIQPLLLKFDPDGNLLWHLPLNTIDPFIENADALAIDQANNSYVAIGNFGEVYIQKISPEGTILSTITQNNISRVTSLAIDSAQNLYAAGSCASSNVVFAGIAVPPATLYNTFVVKYDASGIFQWVKYVEDITCPAPMVVAGSPDEIYFCSYLFGAFAFDGITAEGPFFGSFNDFFLTRLNAEWQFQWMREVPGETFGEFNLGNRNFLALDHSGKIYLGGSTARNIDWGNNVASNIPGNNNDAAVLQYNADGTVERIITGGGDWNDRFDGISIDANGSVYASGTGHGDTDFGLLHHSETAYFPFLTKINMTLNTTSNTKDQVLFYPNPTADELHFQNIGSGSGSIYNMLGQPVQRFTLHAGKTISTSALPSGTYLIAIDGFKAQPLIKK